MSNPPFKVKAVFDYASPHDDDLSFPNGQIITVTEEEDADWYIGEYTEASGEKRRGLFPKNFVERYEPKTPPRPVRPARPREEVEVRPPPSEATECEDKPPPVEGDEGRKDTTASTAVRSAAPTPQALPASRASATPAIIQTSEIEPPPAPKPEPALPAAVDVKATPPAVAEKPSSFKDRIAAFNKSAAPPIAPVKPGAAPATSFIKKPFVAPPPARNAYVSLPIQEPPPQKIYRREEDPEIAEREAENTSNAEKAGLLGNDAPQEGEEAPKPTSLKERIALLQKQQVEQAQRRADASHKEKPKRPPRKHTEARDTAEDGQMEDAELERVESETSRDKSMEVTREPRVPRMPSTTKRRTSRGQRTPDVEQRSEIFSDGNEADQSAAGETTEEAAGLSSDGDDVREHRTAAPEPPARAPGAPTEEQDVGDEDDTTEDEDEMDPETRRRMELRERMAKMSGGMGMAGMFGPAGGMPMPGSATARKKRPSGDSVSRVPDQEKAPTSPQPPRVPIIPVPGMQRAQSPEAESSAPVVENEEESPLPRAGERRPDEVPDVEDVEPERVPQQQSAELRGLPRLPQERPVPAPPSAVERGAAPPLPMGRPLPPPAASRSTAVPPAAIPQTPSAGSQSDDEMSIHTKGSTVNVAAESQAPVPGPPPYLPNAVLGQGTVPPRPQGPRSPRTPVLKQTTYFTEPGAPGPATSPLDNRSSRVPPIPIGSPSMSPPLQARPPPPPPPQTVDAPKRTSIGDERRNDSGEEETEYEGDYDTDIAPGATHKEALKSSHARESSYDDSTTAEESSLRSNVAPSAPPPIPQAATSRAVPPPPPPQVPRNNRQSMEPRAAPPPIPPGRKSMGPGDDDYDPSRSSGAFTGLPSMAAAAVRGPEPQVEEDGHGSSSTRRSIDTGRSMPPCPPHQHDRGLPTPMQTQSPGPPSQSRTSTNMPRRSVEMHRSSTTASRRLMDQARNENGFIASDIDFGEASHWWTVPNTPPPVFQNRKGRDVLYEMEETSTSKRGGKTTISKDVYVLFMDYSQSTITARFDAQDADDVSFEQSHKGPPSRPRQDQLEECHLRFGTRIVDAATKTKETSVGDGTPHALVLEIIKTLPHALPPIGTRAYGALIYANLANASVQQFDEIRPGDIITLRNAKLQGKHGTMHKSYSVDVGTGGRDHVGIVLDWDGTKKKVRVLEQGRDVKDGRKGRVQMESYKIGDLKSGEVKVWRVMDRGWVGWEGSS